LQVICSVLASDEDIGREAIERPPTVINVMAGTDERSSQVQPRATEKTTRSQQTTHELHSF